MFGVPDSTGHRPHIWAPLVRMTSLEEPLKLRNGVTLMSTTTNVSRKAASQPNRNPFAHFPADALSIVDWPLHSLESLEMETNSTDRHINKQPKSKTGRPSPSVVSLFSLFFFSSQTRQSPEKMDVTDGRNVITPLSAGPPHPGPASPLSTRRRALKINAIRETTANQLSGRIGCDRTITKAIDDDEPIAMDAGIPLTPKQ